MKIRNLSARGLKTALTRQANSMGTTVTIAFIDEANKVISLTAEPSKQFPNPVAVLNAQAIVSGWTIKE